MANYTDKNAGDAWLAADGNALADDIGSGSTGHQHDGSEGHATLLPDAIGDGANITWDGRVLFDKGGNIASGSFAIGTDGNYFHVTGTTTVTALGTLQAGTIVYLTFDGILQITHNGTSLILQGAVNVTTAAGEMFAFVSEGSGNWRELFRRSASSNAITALNSATENELVTVGSTTTELDAEAALTFDGTILKIDVANAQVLIDAASGSPILKLLAVSGTGCDLFFTEGTGSGAAGNMQYRLAYVAGSSYFSMRSYDADGGSTDADIWRVADGQQGILFLDAVEIDGPLNHDGSTAGFFGTAPAAKPTGVAVTAAGVHAALVTLGLIAGP